VALLLMPRLLGREFCGRTTYGVVLIWTRHGS
jgi:hypothetical protein